MRFALVSSIPPYDTDFCSRARSAPLGYNGGVDDGRQQDRPWGFATRAVHAGAVPDDATGARAVPISVSYTHLTLPTNREV